MNFRTTVKLNVYLVLVLIIIFFKQILIIVNFTLMFLVYYFLLNTTTSLLLSFVHYSWRKKLAFILTVVLIYYSILLFKISISLPSAIKTMLPLFITNSRYTQLILVVILLIFFFDIIKWLLYYKGSIEIIRNFNFIDPLATLLSTTFIISELVILL